MKLSKFIKELQNIQMDHFHAHGSGTGTIPEELDVCVDINNDLFLVGEIEYSPHYGVIIKNGSHG